MSKVQSLPNSWTTCKLGQVVDYGATQKAEPFEIPDDAWVLELEDIEKDTSKLLNRATFRERQSKSSKNKFTRGDVLYGKLRPYLNKVIRAEEDGYCTTEIVPIQTPREVEAGYLFHWLKHPDFLEYVKSVSHGLNMPRLGTEAGKAAPFVLAPVPEQKRIADKLDALFARVDVCRERLGRVPALLKSFRQAVLNTATNGALTEEWRSPMPLDWRTVTLSEVAEDFSYGSAAKSSKTGNVPVLRMGNIQDGRLDWGDLVYTSNDAEISKYQLQAGDVLFNRTNSPELVGKTAVYKGERPAIYAGYLIRVRCSESLLPDYLNYCLGSSRGRDYCWQVKSDGVSQSNINAKKLAAFTFKLPPEPEQQEIIRRVESLLALADALEVRYTSACHQVERLTTALLAKAFRGELVPQDPEDEPATTLLKRVAVARNTQPAKALKARSLGKMPVAATNTEELLAIMSRLPEDGFTFDQLRAETPSDYETLQGHLFVLLGDKKSGLKQIFDAKSHEMKFVLTQS